MIIKSSKYLVIFLLAISVSIISYRIVLAEEALTLEGVLTEVLKSNPEILSAKRSYEAASARIAQAASLKDPMLELEYDKLYADRELSGNPMKTYALSQEIPFPTKLYLRAKIASKMAKASYEDFKAKQRSIISQTNSSYSELFIIYRSIEVMKENKGVLEQFSSVTARRYSANQGSQADTLKAQIELAKIDNELIMLEQKRLSAQARLNVLMNRDPKDELGTPSGEGPVRFTRAIEELYAMAKQNSPELKSYRLAIDRGKAAYDLALNEFMPDFMIKFKQAVKRDRVDENMWAGMVGVTIPLWFFEKQAFGVKEMYSELEAVKAEYRTKENMVMYDIRDLYAKAEANKKIVELYETAFLPQAEETVNAAMRGYESGKADFLTLLDSQRMLTEFKLDHYRAILELRIALAELEKTVGTDLKN